MGIWREAFRPHCHGLFVEKGRLYAQRYVSEPAFRLLVTPEERDDYLKPIEIPMAGARVFLDIEVGSRRPPEIPDGHRVIAPAVPTRNRGKQLFTVSVFTAANDVYIGYPVSSGEARTLFRAIEKLVGNDGPDRRIAGPDA